jgi:hypothetical protein
MNNCVHIKGRDKRERGENYLPRSGTKHQREKLLLKIGIIRPLTFMLAKCQVEQQQQQFKARSRSHAPRSAIEMKNQEGIE